MAGRIARRQLGFGLMCALLAGCTETYYADTVVRSDGSVRRLVGQPFEGTPEPAREPKEWNQTTYTTSQGPIDHWIHADGRIDLPKVSLTGAPGQFVAWKDARTVRELPDHFVRKAPEGARAPAGRLIRDYQRNDYGFLVEHRWKETLTDCVTLEDMRKARAELTEVLVGLAENVFNQLHGQEYDASGLAHWLRTDGTAWLNEASDALFVMPPPRSEDKLKREIARICGRHGLDLVKDGRVVEGEELQSRLRTFVRDILSKQVRWRDGRRLNIKSADILLTRLGEELSRPWTESIDPAIERAAKQAYGGKAALERRLLALWVRVFGLYNMPLAHVQLDYVLTLPGTVVETNGEILSPRRVRWRFNASEAYPSGRLMEARALEVDAQMDALLPARPFKDRETMNRFVEVVANDKRLVDILRECRRQRSLKPLVAYREELLPKSAATDLKAVDQLRTLLRIDLE